jgi:Tol biopolymer transport system component/uncharacterized protein YjdB
MMTITRYIGLAATGLILLASCSEEPLPPPPPATVPVASVEISPGAATIFAGGAATLSATLKDGSGNALSGRAVTWSSSATAVAVVDASGRVTGIAEGVATITAVSESRVGSATVTVQLVPVASVEVTPSTVELVRGDSLTLVATLRDEQGTVLTGRVLRWSSDQPQVARVDSLSGRAHAVAGGAATITATSGARSAAARVTVRVPVQPVDSVQILPATELRIIAGRTVHLDALTWAADGSLLDDRPIEWTSDDPVVATVSSDGVVTARAAGRTTIRATSEGKSATASILVPTEAYAYELVYGMGTGSNPQTYRLEIDTEGATPRQLFLGTGGWEVSVSPDGAQIAYTCRGTIGIGICVMDRAGINIRRIIGGEPNADPRGGNADQPVWSPDGTQIAFRHWPHGATPGQFNPTRVWVIDANGQNARNLTGDTGSDVWQQHPTWSPRQPDGSYRIAYTQETMSDGYRVGRIHSMRADGSDRRALTSTGYLDDQPSWSPDGTQIVFVRRGGSVTNDLWLVDGNGGSERALLPVQNTAEQRSPVWSPDGHYIAFTSDHEISADNRWTRQVYTVRSDGSQMTRRTDTGAEKENPTWMLRR